MIDIHCHILPQIDDGPSNIRESIEMAKLACQDGITTIVATPHIKERLYPADVIKESLSLLNTRLVELGIPVTILFGAEVNALLDASYLKDYAIQGTNYILLEFPYSHLPRNAKDILFNMALKGFSPIISHPERNPSIMKNPNLLLNLLDSNIFVQITAGSLAGEFGKESRQCATYLLKKGSVNFIASDAHSAKGRRPILTAGLKIAEKIIGKENAFNLVKTNPEALIKGIPLNVPYSL